MRRKTIILTVLAAVLLAGASWALLTPHYYKHGAVTGMVLDNQALLTEAVQEFEMLADDEQLLENVRDATNPSNPEAAFEFEYVSSTDREAAQLDGADWQKLSDEQLVARYGVDIADKLVQTKEFDGLYASFSYYDEERTKHCYVPIENQILNQVFHETDVNQIYAASDRIWFECYEKVGAADVETADFFYMKSGVPEPPAGNYATAQTTKNGWLYKSKYSMCYLEKITGQFYYVDTDGHDPV